MHDLSADAASARVARHVRVHGRVQGVFFRRSLQDEARAAGVVGWVRNLGDGSVEAHLEGAPGAVAACERWIAGGGPPEAEVTEVEATDAVVTGATVFEVR